MIYSDNHQLCVIEGSSVISVNLQPMKVARQFELGFSAGETHYLSQDYAETTIPKEKNEPPKVEDDPEARRELDECSRSLDELCSEIEELEREFMNVDE